MMSAQVQSDNPFVGLLIEAKHTLDPALSALLQVEVSRASGAGQEVEAMLQAAQSLTCRGGKRLRAGLMLAAYRAYSTPTTGLTSAVRHAALALELLQAYFLIHDDWMDQDDTRRGGPTVHTDLSQQFGDAHLGACGAILAGDYLVTLAAREFYAALQQETAGLHPRSSELLQAYTAMQLAAVTGQQLDVIGLSRDSLKVYELKTSSYTVKGPLVVGALLAGAAPQTLHQLEQFALPVGLAFQLRDDLLSLFADPEKTGKPLAGDVSAGKWTWLAQWMHDHATDAQQQVFQHAFHKHNASQVDLTRAVAAVEESGARAAAEAQIGVFRRQAQEHLLKLTLPAASQAMFTGAISALVDRDF